MLRDAVHTTVLVLLLVGVAAAGEITGTLSPASRVESVAAVDRVEKKSRPADYDPETGTYRLRNLPAGTYDLVLETKAGRIEGVDLRVDATAPKTKPLRLEPAELDRGEIRTLAAWLVKLRKERRNDAPEFDAILANVRGTRMKAVYLVRVKPGGERVSFDVPLEQDELPQASDLLLGLISLVRVRDQLPRDFDLMIEMDKTGPKDILVIGVSPELTAEDRKWLVDWVDGIRGFENKRRVLDLDGTGEHARVLVEKVRDKPTSLAVKEPTAFWRIEVFDFEKRYGGWSKVENRFTVIVREQVSIRRFRTYRWMFEKRLGGIRVEADAVTTVPPYEVPETLDPACSRLPY